MPVIAAGRTEEETEKRLGAALLTGQPLITIDNVNGELRGDALCQIIERSARRFAFSASRADRGGNRGMTLFANGNNITIVGDLCRRVVRIDSILNWSVPSLAFTGNPVATVLADAAHMSQRRSPSAALRRRRTPSEAEAGIVRGLVRHRAVGSGLARKADPVDSIEMVRDEDPEKVALGTPPTVWGDVRDRQHGCR